MCIVHCMLLKNKGGLCRGDKPQEPPSFPRWCRGRYGASRRSWRLGVSHHQAARAVGRCRGRQARLIRGRAAARSQSFRAIRAGQAELSGGATMANSWPMWVETETLFLTQMPRKPRKGAPTDCFIGPALSEQPVSSQVPPRAITAVQPPTVSRQIQHPAIVLPMKSCRGHLLSRWSRSLFRKHLSLIGVR